MYIKYKDFVGRLLYYEVLTDGSNNVKILIENKDGEELEFTCSEKQISIPCVIGNSNILYQILNDPKFEVK